MWYGDPTLVPYLTSLRGQLWNLLIYRSALLSDLGKRICFLDKNQGPSPQRSKFAQILGTRTGGQSAFFHLGEAKGFGKNHIFDKVWACHSCHLRVSGLSRWCPLSTCCGQQVSKNHLLQRVRWFSTCVQTCHFVSDVCNFLRKIISTRLTILVALISICA